MVKEASAKIRNETTQALKRTSRDHGDGLTTEEKLGKVTCRGED